MIIGSISAAAIPRLPGMSIVSNGRHVDAVRQMR
jgi:hypothetical protein